MASLLTLINLRLFTSEVIRDNILVFTAYKGFRDIKEFILLETIHKVASLLCIILSIFFLWRILTHERLADDTGGVVLEIYMSSFMDQTTTTAEQITGCFLF